jgi:hypothetical protein
MTIEKHKLEEERKSWKSAEGIISSLRIKQREGDNLVSFQLSGDDYTTFSMFGSLPFAEGDFIKFMYIVKDGRYNNIKEIVANENVHKTPNQADVQLLKQELLGYDDRTVKTILMRCSVDLAIKRNTFTDKEVFTAYERFLEVVA